VDAIELLRSGKAQVFGADSGLIDSIAGGYPGAKLVPGAFNTVRVAVALPKGRSSAAQSKLLEILSEAKRTGVVQRAIEQAGLRSGVRAQRQIDRFQSMLSKKSPRTSCRIRIRNNRIGANGFLNQRCALAPDLESILRARMSKIVFRQHRS
jgi:hypothetical protein